MRKNELTECKRTSSFLVMGIATQLRVGLIFLILLAVVYILFEAHQIANLISGFRRVPSYSQQFAQLSNSCVQDYVQSPIMKQQQWKSDEQLTVISRDFFEYIASQLRDTPYPGVENHTRYVVAKTRRKYLLDVKPLRPEFGPVLNDVTSLKYPIEIQQCRDNIVRDIPSLFVAVISAPTYFHKRNIIRQTWRRHLQMQSDLNSINLAGFGFVVGLMENDNEIQKRIEKERATYDDILQIEMIDDYYNLTLKVVGLLNWINDHCSRVDFVLKVDDDVYVNVQNLIAVMKNLNPSEQSMYGSFSKGLPNRGGKWYISYEDWPWSNYPTYFRGAAILMPGITIGPLLAASQTTPYLPFDDTFLTGLCTAKAGIKVRISDRFFVGGAAEVPDPCHVYTSISWLTDSVAQFNNSHWASEAFYKNVTLCSLEGPDGTAHSANSKEMFDFHFSTGTDEQSTE